MLAALFGVFAALVACVSLVRSSKPRGGWTEELKKKCDDFWVLLRSAEPNTKEIRTHIFGILSEQGGKDFPNPKACQGLAKTYKKVSAFLKMKMSFVERVKIDGVFEEKSETLSFGEYLEELKTKHVHQNVVNGEGKTCSCSYHEEELFYHLLLAGLYSGLHAKTTKTNAFLAVITAMLHDIGKVSTASPTESGHIAYPFHGEMGALILSGIYSEEYNEFFTKETWETMMRTISVHMCSYHLTTFDSYWNKQRANSTRFESEKVKMLLNSLSYGDTFAAFSNQNDVSSWLASRDKWWASVNRPYKTPKNKSKVAVLVRGVSNSGKSAIADIITKDLAANGVSSTIISRDMVMAQQADISVSIRPTGDEYQRLHAQCSEEKAGKAVNTEMRKRIRAAVKAHDVVIIDTVASMYPGFAAGILPSCISNCFVIAIDINANAFTNQVALVKNGLDAQKQMDLSGIRTCFAPVDTKKIDLHNMASKYTFANGPAFVSNPAFVYQVGWNASFFGENSIGLKPAMDAIRGLACRVRQRKFISGTESMNIVDYTNLIYHQSDHSYMALVNSFKMQGYQAGTPSQLVGTKYAHKFINVKYLEHNTNWCCWGREARGTTLYLDSETGTWQLWKFLMLRGAEMLTTLHKKNNINSNENITDGKIDHLSRDQQEQYLELADPEGTPNLIASFKKDGSLFSVALYTGSRAKTMRNVINTACAASKDTFNKTVMETYDAAVGHKKSVLVFQTQGTLMMTKEMYDYTTTALFDRLPGFNPKLSPEMKILAYGAQFFSQITCLFDSLPSKGHIKQILFETICAKRTESFSGNVHTELAVSYETSSMTVISATVIHSGEKSSGNDGTAYHTVYPHFQISEKIYAAGLAEPAFWHVSTSKDMSAMLVALDEVTWARSTIARFFAEYRPVNAHDNYERIVDPEGFVIYDLSRKMSYGKIKSVLYYISHKFRQENVKMLLDLITANPKCSFPLAVLIRDTIAPMDTILQSVKTALCEVVSELLQQQHLPLARILAAYNKSEPKNSRILLSDATFKAEFMERAVRIFAQAFPKLLNTIPNLLEQESAADKSKKGGKTKKLTKVDMQDMIYVFVSNGGANPLPLDWKDERLIKWRSEFVALLVQ
jgi:hypothetical protein